MDLFLHICIHRFDFSLKVEYLNFVCFNGIVWTKQIIQKAKREIFQKNKDHFVRIACCVSQLL